MHSVELKIKSKHLSVEAKIIRFEERKLKDKIDYIRSHFNNDDLTKLETTFHSIRNHRKVDVRNENRATFLARAMISGKPYRVVENTGIRRKYYITLSNSINYYTLERVAKMVARYRDHRTLLNSASIAEYVQKVKDWINKDWIKQ